MPYPRGSEWRRWDLHVHTPSSIVHRYRSTSDPWDRFLSELAALDPSIAVLGINDYLLVEGYRRVQQEHARGSFPSIATVFPVVEFRLDSFVGTTHHLQRLNYHVLFSPEVTPDEIEGQFLAGLTADFRLIPDRIAGPNWSGYISRSNLTAFGARVRASVPESERARFRESDLELGFNSLCVSRQRIEERLRHTSFAGRALTALGKTEWGSFPWGDSSIAAKKDVINSVDLLFTAAETPGDYLNSLGSLRNQAVNYRLLDCSDAHCFSDAGEKDRLGNSLTWINADPTFEGLRHALTEFDDRVFVGETPLKLRQVRSRPADHLASLEIRPADTLNAPDPAFFDFRLELNPGFVAVVGNKGKGKSALLDTIGLLAASGNEPHFSFLNEERFRAPRTNYAALYRGTLAWHAPSPASRLLSDSPGPSDIARARCIPQSLLDEICGGAPSSVADRFSGEINAVLFSHVAEPDRRGRADLQGLIAERTSAITEQVIKLRADLAQDNIRIAQLEVTLESDWGRSLRGEREALQDRLRLLDAAKPTIPPAETPGTTPEAIALEAIVSRKRTEIEHLQAKRLEVAAEHAIAAKTIDDAEQLRRSVSTLKERVEAFYADNEARATSLGLDVRALVSLTYDDGPVETALAEVRRKQAELAPELASEGDASLEAKIQAAMNERNAAKDRLDAPARQRLAREQELEDWNRERTRLTEGSESFRGLRQVREDEQALAGIPGKLTALKASRDQIVRRIHEALLEIVDVYRECYAPALAFIESHELAQRCELSFGAELRQRDLGQRLFAMVNRRAAGTFSGRLEGERELARRIAEVDLSSTDAVAAFASSLDEALHSDQRSSPAPAVSLQALMREGATLAGVYDLVYGLDYLEPFYLLERSGKPLDMLSPGEKGTLLLMFYLLIDKAEDPILLDQPDENLDNQTIKDLLVPAIKEARQRRQVVVITHNPNVAVVADADQIVVAEFDGQTFRYSSGAIEDAPVNERLLEVLEGTWPAFANREAKYQHPAWTTER